MLRRSIWDYYKVQKMVGFCVRNNPLQLRRVALRRRSKPLLHLGSGPNLLEGFVNLDYHWWPKLDLCWDFNRGIPLRDASIDGIFTEHCLEHITFDQCHRLLRECQRILKPGALIRIVVPDAEYYLNLYQRIRSGENVEFYQDANDPFTFFSTPMTEVNRAFRAYGHRFLYDYETMAEMLRWSGFENVRRESFMNGQISQLLVDSLRRQGGSLYVEATKAQLCSTR